MPVKTLWLARHGESVGNVAAFRAETEGLESIPIEYRDADVPLSDTGREQAAALGEWVAAHREGIDTFWVSPYRRARQTLEIALGGEPAPVLVDERLRDRELGVLDRLTRRGVELRYPEEAERRRHQGKYFHRPAGGESWADVALRLRSFLRDALPAEGEGALVVVHDAVVTLVTALLTGMQEEDTLRFAASHPVPNASVTRLEITPEGGWRIAAFAEVEHLRREGADVTVHQGAPDLEHRQAGDA